MIKLILLRLLFAFNMNYVLKYLHSLLLLYVLHKVFDALRYFDALAKVTIPNGKYWEGQVTPEKIRNAEKNSLWCLASATKPIDAIRYLLF